MNALWQMLILSLILTLLMELPLALLLGFQKRELWIVLLVNIATNPIAVLLTYGMQMLLGWNRWMVQLPIETAVVLMEGWIYRRGTDRLHPYWTAFLLNAASYGLGLIWNGING